MRPSLLRLNTNLKYVVKKTAQRMSAEPSLDLLNCESATISRWIQHTSDCDA